MVMAPLLYSTVQYCTVLYSTVLYCCQCKSWLWLGYCRVITAITQFSGNNEPGGVHGAEQTGNANTRWELKLNILSVVIVHIVLYPCISLTANKIK